MPMRRPPHSRAEQQDQQDIDNGRGYSHPDYELRALSLDLGDTHPQVMPQIYRKVRKRLLQFRLVNHSGPVEFCNSGRASERPKDIGVTKPNNKGQHHNGIPNQDSFPK